MRYIIEKKKEEEVKANTEKNEINVIDQFFQNMGSTVKQFSPYLQHLAKIRVFSVISELELDRSLLKLITQFIFIFAHFYTI